MEPITELTLQVFFRRLGESYLQPATLYLLGGSAMCLLGSPCATLDIDYDVDLGAEDQSVLRAVISELASEMQLDVEAIRLAEFAPLPPQAHERRRFCGPVRPLGVYIFDLYSIALSKIARGFESDLEDVLFLLRTGQIEFDQLERHFIAGLPVASKNRYRPARVPSLFRGNPARRWRPRPGLAGGTAIPAVCFGVAGLRPFLDTHFQW